MEDDFITACAQRVIDETTARTNPTAIASAVPSAMCAPPGIDLLLTFNETFAAVYQTTSGEFISSSTSSNVEANVKETHSESPEVASLLQVLPPVLRLLWRLLHGFRAQRWKWFWTLADGSEDELHYDVRVDEAVAALQSHSVRLSNANRAGVSGTLHRISAIQGLEKIQGLTYRIGRHIHGAAEIIIDFISRLMPTSQSLALGAMPRSILVLRAPGVGKTTLLRDVVARITAETLRLRVMVVDTTNEIAAVQNHNPQVIVVDEISNKWEVQAVQTIAQRGVAMVAPAHRLSMSGLLKNPVLRPQAVTVGNVAARQRWDKKKSQLGTQRSRHLPNPY
eukprot:jgi/Chlat1/9239/Chrsp99S08511